MCQQVDRSRGLLNYTVLYLLQGQYGLSKQWITADYDGLRKAMLKHDAKDDLEQRMYITAFLDTYRSIPCTEKDDIPDYCRNFNLIQHCIERKGCRSIQLLFGFSMDYRLRGRKDYPEVHYQH